MHPNNRAAFVMDGQLIDDQALARHTAGPSSTPEAPLRVPLCMPAREARAALAGAGEMTALVTNRGVDVGVVTAEDLARALPAQTQVGDVMSREVVRIDPATDLRRTLRTYREAAWSSAIRRRPGQHWACGSRV